MSSLLTYPKYKLHDASTGFKPSHHPSQLQLSNNAELVPVRPIKIKLSQLALSHILLKISKHHRC